MQKKVYSFVLAGMFAGGLLAQPTLKSFKTHLEEKGSAQIAAKLEISEKMNFLGSLKFETGTNLSKEQAINWLQQQLQLRTGKDVLQNVRTESTNTGVQVQTIQQYYRGIKVEHGRIKVSAANNRVSSMQLEFYPLPDDIAVTPFLTEGEALQKAMNYVAAEKYVWQGYTGNDPEMQRPVGELVYVQDIFNKVGEMVLAFKFMVASETPFSKTFVYVNAVTGKVVFSDKIVKHVNATGSADTRYSGTQTIVTDRRADNVFRLRESRNGDSIITLNMQRRTLTTTNLTLASDFIDSNNVWSSTEFNNANYDNAALDVQWGLEKVSDYWNLVQGRAGWDNNHSPMRSYVHARSVATSGWDNASWGGNAMYYGDGTYLSGNTAAYAFLPLTSLDVTAHELGHAVCQTTAGLVYQRESGGLNEGFSDIWGAAVEHYSGLGAPKQYFKIGEEITPNPGFLRDMQNPNAGGQPDTYLGLGWSATALAGCPLPGSGNDNCGVHTNSGVLNKWFFLIVQGESGTNDIGNNYNITGLGWEKAEKIAYLTELNLTPNSDHAATRTASINAATTLYGACSNEVVQVTNAWFAVGVGASSTCRPTVEFVRGTTTVSEGAGRFAGCTSTAVSIPVKLGSAASAATTLTFTTGGTAVSNVNYALATPTLTFNAGEITKNLIVTVYNNAAIDANRTIILTYSINANGGTGVAGVNNQTHTLNIVNEDGAPAAIVATPQSVGVTLLSENFESTPGILPAGWLAGTFSSATSTVNFWTVGSNGGAGISGQSAYITSDTAAAARPLAYTTTAAADRFLRTRPFSTSNVINPKMRFKYKVEGEYNLVQTSTSNPAALYDYAQMVYSINGTNYFFITDSAFGYPIALYGRGSSVIDTTISLPAALANQPTVYVGFRWINDASDGGNPPLLVDDILVTGQSTVASVETTANQIAAGTLVSGTNINYLYSAADSQLVVRIANPSQNLGCVEAAVTVAGNGQRNLNTGTGSTGTFSGTQKVVQITPAISNTSATYTATLYYTAAELAVWGANRTNLKFLKVRDGVSLSGSLNNSNAVIVSPTSVADSSSTTGIIAYTGNFTGFSQFLLVDPNTVLPINLVDFTVGLKGKNAVLNWTTTQETNNKGFEILRSLDGVNFEVIGFVAGRINSSTGGNYTLTDTKVPVNIAVYYQLRQVDLDGKATLSKTLTVKLTDKGAFVYQVWPNPASSQVNVTFDGGIKSGTVTIIDQQGRKILSKTISQPTAKVTLATSALAAGTYMLQIDNGEVVETQKLVIRR